MLMVVLIVSFGAPGRSCNPFSAVLLIVKCVVPFLSVVGVIGDVVSVPLLEMRPAGGAPFLPRTEHSNRRVPYPFAFFAKGWAG